MKPRMMICALLIASSAHAAMDSASFPVAGSIVMPGSTTGTFTNPAGIVKGEGVRLSLQAGTPDPMDDPNYRALLLAGNGTIGASAGVDYSIPSDNAADRGWAVYGLALNISALDFTLGVSGRTGMKAAEGTDFNVGILLKPTPFITVGATALDIKGKPDDYGAGVGLALFSGVDLVVDAACDDDFKNTEFKPGLKISNPFAGISLSYGTGATAQFAKDFSGAAYLQVGSNSELEFEYNHGGDLAKYYAALSLGF